MADEVTEHTMLGKTALERKLNAYLTCNYIGTKDLPTDECLVEANMIVQYFNCTRHNGTKGTTVSPRFLTFIELFLSHTFFDGSERECDRKCAAEILNILQADKEKT